MPSLKYTIPSKLIEKTVEFYTCVDFKIISNPSDYILSYFNDDLQLTLTCDDTIEISQDYIPVIKNLINTPSFSPSLSLTTTSLDHIASLLSSIHHPFILSKTTLITCDPCLNSIQFSITQSSFKPSKPIQTDHPLISSSITDLSPHSNKRIGILCSGGDSSGMNPAVRAIVRYSLFKKCTPFAIFNGYEGLVNGGDLIKEFGWEDVRGMLSVVCLFNIGWNKYRICSLRFF